jgi:paired amphipathic helix protein Sin3a
MQLLGKDDHIWDDSISSEEKWSLYVDQFVQLSTTEGSAVKRREPFLKRNLPKEVGDDPPLNVETVSGLELKICVNTYKIFFVDNTEDYFRRKHSVQPNSLLNLDTGSRAEAESAGSKQRAQKMNQWIEWKVCNGSEDAAKNQEIFDAWISKQ